MREVVVTVTLTELVVTAARVPPIVMLPLVAEPLVAEPLVAVLLTMGRVEPETPVLPDVLKRVCASAATVNSIKRVINVRKRNAATIAKRAEANVEESVFIAFSPN